MIKNNVPLHGNAKALGFMEAEAVQDRLASPKVISVDLQEKPLLDHVLLFSDTEIQRGYLCRHC